MKKLPVGTRCTQCLLMHNQPAANFSLTPRVCRRKRNFIFEDMPNITGMTPLHVMLLERSKKELYTWSHPELWSYLDKMGYDLIIDAIPQKQERTPLPPTPENVTLETAPKHTPRCGMFRISTNL